MLGYSVLCFFLRTVRTFNIYVIAPFKGRSNHAHAAVHNREHSAGTGGFSFAAFRKYACNAYIKGYNVIYVARKYTNVTLCRADYNFICFAVKKRTVRRYYLKRKVHYLTSFWLFPLPRQSSLRKEKPTRANHRACPQ